MEFRLLGQLEVVDDDGTPVPVRGYKPRLLLAILLLRPNQPVPVKALMDGLWGDRPPNTARSTIQYFVHQLREAFGERGAAGGILVTETGGYRLRVGEGGLDVHRFEAAVRRAGEARAAGDLPAAAAALDQGLGLWRGSALADFAAEPFAEPYVARLEEQRITAVEERAELGLALGQHTELVGELEELILTHPFRERLCELLMRALYRSGRQADALGAYQAYRRRLADGLDVEPTPGLRRLERQILGQDPTLNAPGQPPGSPFAPAAAGATAEPAPTDQAPAAEERRVVTVLVAGLAATSQPADPEDVWARRAEVLGPVLTAVGRYGGTVLSVIGGTVMAVFGVPAAREDDAERAVRAALVAAGAAPGGPQGRLRVGVDTGEVVAAPGPGYGAATDGQVALAGGVSGRVLDTAMALSLAAGEGTVVVGQAAWRATKSRIDYEPAEAGAAWRALAPRSRPAPEPPGGGQGPSGQLLERDYELSMLASLFERVRESRAPQLVTLIGAPGIGKTRLIAELGRQAERDPDLITWRQGRSLPYGEREDGDTALATFWPLTEVVRAHVGIAEGDDPAAAAAKLDRAVADLLGDDQDGAGRVAGQLRRLLYLDGAGGLGGEVDDDRQATFAAWTAFLAAVAADRPLVLALEDLHWADAALLDFLGALVDQAGPVPLLVVCTARPELLARRPGWGGGKPNTVTLTLKPLSVEGSAKLLDALLGADGAPALSIGTRELLLARAAGNPLFVEEYVRMLRDRQAGAGDLPIPETVQQLITARIDRLGPERRLLQDLAVLGEPGWVEPLIHLAGLPAAEVEAALARLEQYELLRRARIPTDPNEVGYLFRHPLIREVAYRQLLRADRAARHRLVAAWLEGRPDRPVDLLAHHYGMALAVDDPGATVDGDLRDRGMRVMREAGDRALALSAWDAAVRHYRDALALWPEDCAAWPELLYRLGRALMYGEHGGRDELTRARESLAAAGNQRLVDAIDGELRLLALIRGDADGLDRPAQPDGARQILAPETAVAVAMHAVDLLMVQDRPKDAARAANAVIELAAGRVPEAEGMARAVLGAAMLQLGDLGGEDQFAQSFALLGATQHPALEKIRWGYSWYLWIAGAMDRCAVAIEEGRRAMHTAGGVMLDWFEITQATIDYSTGRWDRVVALVDRLSAEPSDENRLLLPWCLLLRGRVRLGRGDLDGALADAEAAEAAAMSGRRARQVAAALGCRALLASGDRDGAGRLADRLLDDLHASAEGSQATPDLAVTLADLGRGPGALPDGLPPTRWHLAVRMLADGDAAAAADAYARLGSPIDAADARLRAARRAAPTDPEAARALLAPAVALWREAGASRRLDEAGDLLGTGTF